MSDNETALDSVPGIPSSVIDSLRKRWITSAEQLVALGASTKNIEALATELGIDEHQTSTIVSAARRILDPEVVAELERPVDTSRFSLGAHKPRRPRDDRDT